MITATKMQRVNAKMLEKARGKEIKTDKIVRELLQESNFKDNTYTQYEIISEEKAVKAYTDIMTSKHQNFHFEHKGLVLLHDSPFIGGSPDGIAQCECHAPTLVEIKCPFNVKDKSPREFDHPFLKNPHNKKHPFYAQVQTNMAVTQTEQSDVVFWSSKGCNILRIPFDPQY